MKFVDWKFETGSTPRHTRPSWRRREHPVRKWLLTMKPGRAGVPAWLVAGNMDRDLLQRLDAATQGSTVTYWHSTVEVPIENDTYLVATHGDNEELLAELIRGEQFPYVCHGHTHHARDVRQGQTRIICPGALAGPRHPHVPTVALLDTVADTVEFYDVAQPDRPIGIEP